MFFSKFTSPEQPFAAALCQDTQHQQPQRHCRHMGKACDHPIPMQQHLPQQEIQRTGLSVHAPSLTNSNMLKVTTVLQQIMRELSEAVSEKDKITVITKMVLNFMKQNGC
jgi:hypothetical protein